MDIETNVCTHTLRDCPPCSLGYLGYFIVWYGMSGPIGEARTLLKRTRQQLESYSASVSLVAELIELMTEMRSKMQRYVSDYRERDDAKLKAAMERLMEFVDIPCDVGDGVVFFDAGLGRDIAERLLRDHQDMQNPRDTTANPGGTNDALRVFYDAIAHRYADFSLTSQEMRVSAWCLISGRDDDVYSDEFRVSIDDDDDDPHESEDAAFYDDLLEEVRSRAVLEYSAVCENVKDGWTAEFETTTTRYVLTKNKD